MVYPMLPKPIKYKTIELDFNQYNQDSLKLLDLNCRFYIIQSKTNLGFAVANNAAMNMIENNLGSDYYFLLNNDTVIHPDAVIELLKSLENDEGKQVAQSTIYNYYKPEIVANAGGKILFWGQTKYYKKIKKDTIKDISFINGCALMINAEVLKRHGYLSDKFFFGEEDFEFSMRMKKNEIKMISVANSIVYHKIGSSSDVLLKAKEKKMLIFALNRIIDLKDFYSHRIWLIWKYLALIYFSLLLINKYHVQLKRSIRLMKELNNFTNTCNDVHKETIDKLFKEMGL